MKKIILCGLLLVAMLGLYGCSGGSGSDAGDGVAENTAASEASVFEAADVTIDGLAVNDGYVEDGSSLKVVYLFMTYHPQDVNLSLSSDMLAMRINDNNFYPAEHYPDDEVGKYLQSYYYGSVIEDTYMGETKKVLATFKVPEADLAAGRSIVLEDSTGTIPSMEDIRLSTDDIQHFASADELVTALDPEGYAAEMDLRSDADPDTVALVQSQINGYRWSFYVNYISYELDFWADNNFSVRATINGASSEPQQGTYSVKKGYVFCTYPSNNYTVEIPYTITNGVVELDPVAGFNVSE